jgi:hypothetical protein
MTTTLQDRPRFIDEMLGSDFPAALNALSIRTAETPQRRRNDAPAATTFDEPLDPWALCLQRTRISGREVRAASRKTPRHP